MPFRTCRIPHSSWPDELLPSLSPTSSLLHSNSDKHDIFSVSKTLFDGTEIETIVNDYIKIQENNLQPTPN